MRFPRRADEHKSCERIEEKADKLIRGLYSPLVLRPDVIRETAVFPKQWRRTLLHTIGDKFWTDSYEWELLKLMHSAALERNERFIELRDRKERQAPKGKRLDKESWRLYRQIEWGQRKRQFILLNGVINRLLAEAADPAALQDTCPMVPGWSCQWLHHRSV
jgi:hypothetical protein